MSSPPQDATIALTRFGLGARSGEIATVARDPRGWLAGQIRPDGAPIPAGEFETTDQRVESWHAYQAEARDARQVRRESGQAAMQPAAMQAQADENPQAQAAFDARRRSRRNLVQDTAQEFLARAKLGATTDAGFAERWALFWANAFTASATKFQTAVFVGQYEREAIRPHVFGRFEDLTLAAERQPAMLLYLDQAQSVGPNSMAGERRQAGLNENLAREILGLHRRIGRRLHPGRCHGVCPRPDRVERAECPRTDCPSSRRHRSTRRHASTSPYRGRLHLPHRHP